MAKYTSKYPELAFYVNGVRKQFSNGVYVTEDKDEIVALGLLRDVNQVNEPKAEQPKQTTKAKAPAKK